MRFFKNIFRKRFIFRKTYTPRHPEGFCQTCGRKLSTDEPMSADCGGDCWGCISEIEAEMLDMSVEEYRKDPVGSIERARS